MEQLEYKPTTKKGHSKAMAKLEQDKNDIRQMNFWAIQWHVVKRYKTFWKYLGVFVAGYVVLSLLSELL